MKTTVGRRGKRIGIIGVIIAFLLLWLIKVKAGLLLILMAVAIVMLLGGLFVSFAIKAAKIPHRDFPEDTNSFTQVSMTWNHTNPLVAAPYVPPEEVRPTFTGTLYFSNAPEGAIFGVLRTRDFWTFEMLYSIDLDGWTEGPWTELRFTDHDASESQGFYTGIQLFP